MKEKALELWLNKDRSRCLLVAFGEHPSFPDHEKNWFAQCGAEAAGRITPIACLIGYGTTMADAVANLNDVLVSEGAAMMGAE